MRKISVKKLLFTLLNFALLVVALRPQLVLAQDASSAGHNMLQSFIDQLRGSNLMSNPTPPASQKPKPKTIPAPRAPQPASEVDQIAVIAHEAKAKEKAKESAVAQDQAQLDELVAKVSSTSAPQSNEGPNEANEGLASSEKEVPKGPSVSDQSESDFKKRPIRLLHIQLGGTSVFRFIKTEIQGHGAIKGKTFVEIRLPNIKQQNPFGFSRYNFDTGGYRPADISQMTAPPVISERDASWYQEQLDQDLVPDILYIGGHQIPGMGWHSDETDANDYYLRSIYFPTLLESVKKYPAMKEYFARIKIIFIGGCWGLANLEPHGPHGEYLSPQAIEKIYFSSAKGRSQMLGNIYSRHSLEYQRHELYTLYDGDFSNGPKAEVCRDPVNFKDCLTFNAQRVLPDIGLYDGSHSYNYPYLMKHLFSGAYLVFGFHSPSPYNENVAPMYRTAFDWTRQKIGANENLFLDLLDPGVSVEQKKQLVQTLRLNWTKATYRLNREAIDANRFVPRPAASISPIFPELDANGPFVGEGMEWAPTYAPYEER